MKSNRSFNLEFVSRKLGPHGAKRFKDFLRMGSSSSDNELAPLKESQKAFLDFLEIAPLPPSRNSSIFLTDEGHLELCWEDSEGKSIQFEFGPETTEVYLEASGIEQTFPHAQTRLQLKKFNLP